MAGTLNIVQIERLIWRKHPSYSKIEVVVETGTGYGHTAIGLSHHFKKIITIELSEKLYGKLRKKKNNIDFRFGDSVSLLPQILRNIGTAPILFYLDAHYSGGESETLGAKPTVLEELKIINRLRNNYDVIVIDDCRYFGVFCDGADWRDVTEASILACLDGKKICDHYIEDDKMFIFTKPLPK